MLAALLCLKHGLGIFLGCKVYVSNLMKANSHSYDEMQPKKYLMINQFCRKVCFKLKKKPLNFDTVIDQEISMKQKKDDVFNNVSTFKRTKEIPDDVNRHKKIENKTGIKQKSIIAQLKDKMPYKEKKKDVNKILEDRNRLVTRSRENTGKISLKKHMKGGYNAENKEYRVSGTEEQIDNTMVFDSDYKDMLKPKVHLDVVEYGKSIISGSNTKQTPNLRPKTTADVIASFALHTATTDIGLFILTAIAESLFLIFSILILALDKDESMSTNGYSGDSMYQSNGVSRPNILEYFGSYCHHC